MPIKSIIKGVVKGLDWNFVQGTRNWQNLTEVQTALQSGELGVGPNAQAFKDRVEKNGGTVEALKIVSFFADEITRTYFFLDPMVRRAEKTVNGIVTQYIWDVNFLLVFSAIVDTTYEIDYDEYVRTARDAFTQSYQKALVCDGTLQLLNSEDFEVIGILDENFSGGWFKTKIRQDVF